MPTANQNPFSVGSVIYNTEIKVHIIYLTKLIHFLVILISPLSFQIVDHETRQILEPGKIGEICIRSEGNFKTYIGNDEAAKDTLVDGWVCTGDLGYYSEDKQLYITTRVKEIIKFENSQVSRYCFYHRLLIYIPLIINYSFTKLKMILTFYHLRKLEKLLRCLSCLCLCSISF